MGDSKDTSQALDPGRSASRALVPAGANALTLAAPQVVALESGRAIEVATLGGDDLIRIRGKDGACVLTVTMTDAGPVLRFESAALELVAPRSLDVACGELRIESSGPARIAAKSIALEARTGSVEVKANDDVRLNGERVQLNSTDPPIPLTYDEYLARKARPTHEP